MIAQEANAEDLSQSYRDRIDELIAENRIKDALDSLQDYVKDLAPEFRHAVLLLRRKESEYKIKAIKGTADDDSLSEIASTILDLAAQVAEAAAMPSSPPPVPSHAESTSVARKFASYIDAGRRQPAKDNDRATRLSLVPHVNEIKTPEADQEEFSNTPEEQQRNHWRKFRAEAGRDLTVMADCQDVSATLGNGTFSLQRLSLSLNIGEVTAIAGTNGSGKTTLLRLIISELAAGTGSVTYPVLARNGETWNSILSKIYYIRQDIRPWPGKLRTNLLFHASSNHTYGRANNDLVDWYIRRYDLSGYENATYQTLSGGYRLRYELVKALVSRPQILVLDEPFASLDIISRQEFLRNIRSIAYSLRDPMAVVLTSQNLYDIDAIADQIIILDEGRCRFAGSLETMMESTTRLYEIVSLRDVGFIRDKMGPIGMKVIEETADGCIVEGERVASSVDGALRIYKSMGDHVIGVRDISRSARRFMMKG